MTGAFFSELLKLRRRGLLLGGGGLLLGFTALFTVLGIENAQKGAGTGRGFRISVAELSKPDGLVHGITRAGTLLGIVMLGIFAAAFGTEYTTGALRNLLVREPRRVRLLAGKYLALLLFGLAIILLACVVSIVLALALAPSKGIDTSAWTSSTGLADTWRAIWHLVIAALGYGTVGAALAIIFRSSVAALAIGVAWLLPAEAILSALWSNGQYWLPGQLLTNLVGGGSSSVSLARTGLTLVIYWAIIVVGTSVLFLRRDVAT
jgi:ABC-type transport system involved in multi-copper enzyme maturation permease subunit